MGMAVPKGSSTTEQLPEVALEAVWVAMPRSHLHLQEVAQLQDTFRLTVEWVVKEVNIKPKKRAGRRGGTSTGLWAGHLALFTERRLVWWTFGGEKIDMEGVPWTHAKMSRGILTLSLDCARRVRVASGDTAGGQEWEWNRVPVPFRDWLALRGKGRFQFKQDVTDERVSDDALKEWGHLDGVVEGLRGQEGHNVLPGCDFSEGAGIHIELPDVSVHRAQEPKTVPV